MVQLGHTVIQILLLMTASRQRMRGKANSMKKKNIHIVTAILIITILAYFGPFTAQATQKTIELRVISGHAETHVAQVALKEWIKRIENRSGRRIQMQVFWGTFGKVTDFYDMVKNGVVDIAEMGTGWSGGRMPICEIVDLPFESPDMETTGTILHTLLSRGLLKELDPFKVMEIHSQITGNLFLTNRKVVTLEQLAGMKIRPIPGVTTQLVESWGGVPVAVRTPDLYMALQKGQIDGFLTSPDNAVGMKLYEVCRYQVRIPTFNGVFVTIMNKNSWNRLPPDLQNVIEEVNEEMIDFRLSFYRSLSEESQKKLDERIESYRLSIEEEARWKRASEGITETWINKMEAKGLPGRSAVTIMRSLVALESSSK